MPRNYTVKQAADLLGYSTNSIYAFLREGKLVGKRIGRGKFKISHSEIARFSPIEEVPHQKIPPTSVRRFDTSLAHTPADAGVVSPGPGIFDWFVGMVSLLCGGSLFLYNAYFSQVDVAKSLARVQPLRIALLIAGAGLLLSAIIPWFAKTKWKTVFYIVIALLFALIGIGFYRMNDMDGQLVYGLLTVLIGLHVALRLRGITTMSLYICLVIVTLPFVSLLVGKTTTLTMPYGIGNNPFAWILLWLIVSIVLFVFLWWGYFRKRFVYWIVLGVLSVGYCILALISASGAYWSRSLIFLMTAIVSILLPAWDTLTITNATSQRGIRALFLSILVLCFVTLGVVGVVQNNAIETAHDNLTNKAEYGRLYLEGELAKTKSIVANTINNASFKDALESSDESRIKPMLRVLYDSGQIFRLAYALDRDGDVVAVYPNDPVVMRAHLGQRQYFVEARDQGKISVSDVFHSVKDRPAVVVAGPIYDADGVFLGEIALSLDLPQLGEKLLDLAAEERGEYFFVLDDSGTFMIHPNASLVGTKHGHDPTVKESQVFGFTFYDISLNSQGVNEIHESLRLMNPPWEVHAAVPLVNVLKPSKTITVAIAFIIGASVFIVGVYIVWRTVRDQEKPG